MTIKPIFLIPIFLLTTLFGIFIGRTFFPKISPPEIVTPPSVEAGIISLSTDEDETTVSEASKIEETQEEEPSLPLVKNSDINHARTKTGISDKKIGQVLTTIAENLEAKKLAYISSKMQDCSGIYHQIKDLLQDKLPSLAKSSGKYEYPSAATTRNTRQIADWFFKRGNLLIVQDAVASRNSIRPGSVMFYAKPGRKYQNIDIDMLTDRNNNYTSNAAIMHIAVVTAVTTDAEGNIKDYTIMHGRNSRNHASRTGSKEVQSTRTKGLPAFGNWSQQWVAMANIVTEK